jgi:hypothetical protein
MPTFGKSMGLGAAFLAGIPIAAMAAPAPDTLALQQNPSGPTPEQPSIGRDGSYVGSMTQVG